MRKTYISRLVSYVGSDRRPAGETPRAEHYYVRLALSTGVGSRTVDSELELSARHVALLLEALPTRIREEALASLKADRQAENTRHAARTWKGGNQ
jgi:hypothetical protein